jgi:hypothetical protein
MNIKNKRKRIYANRLVLGSGLWSQIQKAITTKYTAPLTEEGLRQFMNDLAHTKNDNQK